MDGKTIYNLQYSTDLDEKQCTISNTQLTWMKNNVQSPVQVISKTNEMCATATGLLSFEDTEAFPRKPLIRRLNMRNAPGSFPLAVRT